MIVKVRGELSEVGEASAVIDRDGMAYEVLVPSYAVRELAASRGPAVAAYTARQIPEDTTYLPSAAADGDAAAPSGRRRPEVPAGAQRCRRRGTVAERR